MHTRGSPPRPPGLGFGEHDYVPTTETTRVTIAATSVMPALSLPPWRCGFRVLVRRGGAVLYSWDA